MKRKMSLFTAALLALAGVASAHAQGVLPGTADPTNVSDPQVLRAVVRAETAEWRKLGLAEGDEVLQATPEQERLIRIAGLKAEADATGARFDPATVPPVQASTLSRAEVAGEAREALKLGLLDDRAVSAPPLTPEQQYRITLAGVKADDAARGLPFNATSVAPPMAEAPLSRAQVKAEAREARALGLLDHGEANAPDATPEQQALITQAGVAAVGETVAHNR